MKPGYLTTEFWATLTTLGVSAASDFGAGPALAGQVHDILAALGPAVVAVYAVVRTVLKIRSGPSVASRGSSSTSDVTDPAPSGAVLVTGGVS